jgi:hypothetical protein
MATTLGGEIRYKIHWVNVSVVISSIFIKKITSFYGALQNNGSPQTIYSTVVGDFAQYAAADLGTGEKSTRPTVVLWISWHAVRGGKVFTRTQKSPLSTHCFIDRFLLDLAESNDSKSYDQRTWYGCSWISPGGKHWCSVVKKKLILPHPFSFH